MESAAEFIERKSRQWQANGVAYADWKDIGREGIHNWIREPWTFHIQHNLPEKILVVERLSKRRVSLGEAFIGGAQPDDIEYRLGYWTVGRIGRASGRWVWGQFSPMIPEEDLKAVLATARADGTIRP